MQIFTFSKSFEKNLVAIIVLAAAVFVQPAVAQQDTRTPEEKAVDYREGVFHVLEYKFGQMVAAKFSGNSEGFAKHAGDMAYAAGLIDEGFIPDSIVGDSAALPAIWENREDFASRGKDLQDAAAALAASGDAEGFDPRAFGGDYCGSCHRKYKEED